MLPLSWDFTPGEVGVDGFAVLQLGALTSRGVSLHFFWQEVGNIRALSRLDLSVRPCVFPLSVVRSNAPAAVSSAVLPSSSFLTGKFLLWLFFFCAICLSLLLLLLLPVSFRCLNLSLCFFTTCLFGVLRSGPFLQNLNVLMMSPDKFLFSYFLSFI